MAESASTRQPDRSRSQDPKDKRRTITALNQNHEPPSQQQQPQPQQQHQQPQPQIPAYKKHFTLDLDAISPKARFDIILRHGFVVPPNKTVTSRNICLFNVF